MGGVALTFQLVLPLVTLGISLSSRVLVSLSFSLYSSGLRLRLVRGFISFISYYHFSTELQAQRKQYKVHEAKASRASNSFAKRTYI